MNPDQPSYQPQPPTQPQPSSLPPQTEGPKPPVDDPYARAVYSDTGAAKSPKKRLLLWSGVVVFLALMGGGAVFGFYLPNQPSNVWKTGLNRTGDALEKTTASMTEKSKLEAFGKSQMSGSAELKGKDYAYTASFSNKFDKNKSDGNLDVIAKNAGQPDKKFGAKFLSELKEGSMYPSIYFQLSGLKTLGIESLEQYLPGVSGYEGKWIAIEEEYIRSLVDQARQMSGVALPETTTPTETKKEDRVTADDVAGLTRTISGLTSEYVFTADPAKAIFEQRKFVGKETVEDMKTYHYEVGINKAHAKDFCKAAVEKIFASSVYKKTLSVEGVSAGADADKQQQESTIKGCQESVDTDIKDDRTFDMWIDAKYKLVHKIRMSSEDKSSYVDFGQIYKGGDDLSLFIASHTNASEGSNESNVKITIDTNLKSNETKANFTAKAGRDESAIDVTATFEAKPLTEEIKIEKPTGAVPIKNIFDTYGVDPVGLVSLGLLGMGSDLQALPSESDTSGTPTPLMYTN